MNRRTSVTSLVLFLLIAGFCLAAEEAAPAGTEQAPAVKQKDKAQVPPAGTRQGRGPLDDPAARGRMPQNTDPGARGRGPANPEDRQAMYNQLMAQRGASQQDMIKELNEIKKIAQEENATKTVAAIDALIEKKDKEFKNQQAEQEKRREEFRKRMEERTQRQGQGTGVNAAPEATPAEQPAVAPVPAPEAEKKADKKADKSNQRKKDK